MKRFGFSTLELAVATAFLAVIVAALIMVSNPLEQARKERDLRVKQDAQILLSAINQYFLMHGRLPWSTDSGNLTPSLPWTQIGDKKMEIVLERLISSNLLPQDFASRKTILDPKDRFWLSRAEGPQALVFACFLPESETQRRRTGELYRIDTSKPFPPTGVLPSCPSKVSWEEEDVCWVCFGK
jgi:type II secretory pathway pseudopilin PulG